MFLEQHFLSSSANKVSTGPTIGAVTVTPKSKNDEVHQLISLFACILALFTKDTLSETACGSSTIPLHYTKEISKIQRKISNNSILKVLDVKPNKNLFNSFVKQGFPTTKNEEWKYTSLKKIIDFDYCLNLKNSEIDSSLIKNYSLGLKNKIIFSDEKLISFPNITGLKINGFSSSDCNSDEAFALLNSALSNSGFNISVEKNTVVSDPIEILFFNNTKNGFCQYRNKIFIGESSKVKFIEKIQDLSNSSNLVNNYTEIFSEKN